MPEIPFRKPSWRGVPFAVWDQEGVFGRATALHEYPFRDPVWVEDLGRGTRRLGLVGFAVGDDVAALDLEMIEAAEEEGPGQLVHPTLGLLKVSLVDFRSVIRSDLGRVVEFHFLFVEDGTRRFPDTLLDTGKRIGALADLLDGAASADFATRAAAALKAGADVARQVRSTVAGWTRVANRLAGDARAVLNAVGLVVPGVERRFSRFALGYRRALAPVDGRLRTVEGGLNGLARARRAVASAAEKLTGKAGEL